MSTQSQPSLLDQTKGPEASPAQSNLPATTDQPPAAETKLIQITETEQQQVFEIQQIVNECGISLANSVDDFSRTLVLAKGMRMLRAAFSKEIMGDIMQLVNSPLGFMSDRPNSKQPAYSEEEIRDAVIHAALKGARTVGNEFTIISRKAYLNKEHFERKVREIDGLTDLELHPGAPVLKDGTAWVPFVASWMYQKPGTTDRRLFRLDRTVQKVNGEVLDNRVVVRVNDGGGADMAIGKATRKVLAQVYTQMTGSKLSNIDPAENIDVDPGEAIVQEAPADNFAGEADAAHDAAGGAQTSKLAEVLNEYGLELDQATDQVSIPLAAKARSNVVNNHKDLPPEVRAQVDKMHDDAVKTIRAKKAAAPQNRR